FPLVPWQLAEAESALGACLTAQRHFAEAERLLADCQAGIESDPRPAFRRVAKVRLEELRRQEKLRRGRDGEETRRKSA
ncbi:MAG TPA: hypothetical protein VI455_17245, partial [Terriglobia bacterium]